MAPFWILTFVARVIKILFKIWELQRILKVRFKDIDKIDGLTFEKYL